MKLYLSLVITLILCIGITQGQTIKTVGGTGANYASMKLAFDAINSGNIKGVITLQITGNTSETASAALNASGTGSSSYTSVLIYPTAAELSISAAGNWAAIDLNGADNVTIDGRINQSGDANLTIINANNGTFSSAIRFITSAENNTIKYCNIKSSCYSAGVGVINFTSSNTGNGNDNNIIEFCKISNAGGNRPICVIFSSGSSGRENNGNIIRNNNIFDFFNANTGSFGINITNNSTDWIIANNSFYETTSFTPSGAYKYYVINVISGNNNLISNNFIGGSQPLCAGSAWTTNANTAHYFCGIFTNGTTIASILQNNTIQNINYTSIEDNPWDGIFINAGNVNVTGNTIGATTGTGSVIISTPVAVATTTISGGSVNGFTILNGGSGYLTAPTVSFPAVTGTTAPVATAVVSGGMITSLNFSSYGSGYISAPSVIFDEQSNNYSTSHGMINNSTGIVTISNNNIGSITTAGTNYFSHGFESIYIRGIAATTTLSNNLIGSLTTPNSIYASSAAAFSLIKQDVYGLYSSGTITTIMTGNTVANLTNGYAGNNSGTRTRGIVTTAGSNTILNNTIRDISSASKQSSGASAASVAGISQTCVTAGTTQIINGNTIYNLSNTNPTAKSYVLGIYYTGPATGTNTVSGNFVYSLSISSADLTSDLEGIELNTGNVSCANNIINLGAGVTSGYKIYGIWDESNSALYIKSILFNSVYLGGSVAAGITSSTSALWSQTNFATRDYRNNILFNARSGGSSGKHYALYLNGKTGLTVDYNDYFVTAGTLGKIVNTEYTTLDAPWKTASGGDINSLNINPGFTSAGSTQALDYYTSAALPAVTGTGILTDYSGVTRNATVPQMGALENNDFVWRGTINSVFGVAGNWERGIVPPDGSDISFDVNPGNHCVLDQNRSFKNIVNINSGKNLITNGFKLTITGNLNFTGSAQINATSASSVIVFAGSFAQSIPSGLFANNSVNALTVNNSNGITLNGNLTIEQTLTLSSGAFAIGANSLILNGALSVTSGALTGGTSSDLTFGGTGSGTNLPAIVLNNLTLNRPGGINLTGSVSIEGTLALSSGTITVGANTLTISGSSPTSGGGLVDASNGSAGIEFSNVSAISLPPTFFAGGINNLTLSGAGGVTAGSDITVNGELNLASANPSATKGLLEMTISYTNYPGTLITDYLNSHILNMGATATTIGAGDVTGTVKRASIAVNTPYTFGHQYTTISLTPGIMPATLAVTITIGNSPGNSTPIDDIIRDAIRRTYEIVPTGGSDSYVTANFHYLDSELTSSNSPYHVNLELKLTTMDYDIDGGNLYSDEHGRANYDYTNNYIGLSSVPISYFIQIPVIHQWRTIFALRDYGVDYFTWNGSISSDWGNATNWTLSNSGSGIPTEFSHVIIPDVATTSNRSPVLPSSAIINTLSIENGGILTMGSSTLTIQNSFSGGWEDQNPMGNNPGTSKVIFSTPNTTISGNARFYNIEITDDADITNQTGSIMKIGNSISRTGSGTGKWYADIFGATVEYNGGAQTVLQTDGSPQYHNLILSGSGTKLLPSAALTLHGDLLLSGTASGNAAGNMSIGGNLTIGQDATFGTGSFSHIIGGDINCDGTLNSGAGSSVTLNGTVIQSIYGSGVSDATFDKLILSNSSAEGILFNKNVTANNNLTITNGSKLSVSPGTNLTVTGTLNNNAGVSGLILKSGSSLIENNGVAATVGRDLAGDEWHLISAPISDATSGIFTGKYLQMHTESTNAYTDIIPTNVALIPMKGYALWGDAGDYTITFAGMLNAGTQSYNTSFSGAGKGWNLVGNPYPSSIDWNASSGWTKTNVYNSTYLHINAANWATFNGNVGTNGGTRYISPCQGFFIEANASGTLEMNDNVRVHNPVQFFKNTEGVVPNLLRMQVSGNGYRDEAVVMLESGSTPEFDGQYDARKLFGDIPEAPQIYSLGTSALSINCLPAPQSVPVAIHSAASGSFTISAIEVNDLNAIRLEDTKTGIFTNLLNDPYTFSFEAGENEQRFILHFDALGIKQNPDGTRPEIYTSGSSLYIYNIPEGTSDIYIRNIIGQVVNHTVLKGKSTVAVNLSGLPFGMYIATFTNKKQSYSSKITLK